LVGTTSATSAAASGQVAIVGVGVVAKISIVVEIILMVVEAFARQIVPTVGAYTTAVKVVVRSVARLKLSVVVTTKSQPLQRSSHKVAAPVAEAGATQCRESQERVRIVCPVVGQIPMRFVLVYFIGAAAVFTMMMVIFCVILVMIIVMILVMALAVSARFAVVVVAMLPLVPTFGVMTSWFASRVRYLGRNQYGFGGATRMATELSSAVSSGTTT
jgi:hypothetical protein